MRDIFFLSEDYLQRNFSEYRLSISIRQDGFSFLISRNHFQDIIAYAYTMAEVNEESCRTFINQECLQKDFASVDVIFVSQKYTLVPSEFYDKESEGNYLEYNIEMKPTEEILSFASKDNAVVLYAVESSILALCKDCFGGELQCFPHVISLLNTKEDNGISKLKISLESTFFTSVYIENQQIKFCNTFEFKNINDFLYYVMNIFEQLQIDREQILVEVSGKINEKSQYFTALQMFIKNVSMVEPLVEIQGFPYTLFYNHCKLNICE